MEVSQPANPSEPSFLTKLPGEVRNKVYRLLFRHEEPLVLMNPDELYEEPGWIEYEDEIDPENTMVPAEEILGPAMPFLLTCRQIFHEAIGVLYGSNTFLVSVPSHRHNKNSDQISYAVQWMRTIGNSFSLLRDVQIDIDPICYEHCCETDYEQDTQLDLLPLVCLLWNMKAKPHFRLKFVNGEGKLSWRLHQGDEEAMRVSDAELLNNVLRSLAVLDKLNIARYGKFERLLVGIYIDVHQDIGEVVYNSAVEDDTTHPFSIRKRGKVLHWEDWKIATEGHRFPKYVRDKIISYAIASADPMTLNLNRKTASGLNFNLLQINTVLRERTKLRFASENQLTLCMTTNEDVTSFGNFECLREWKNSHLFHMFPKSLEPRTSPQAHHPELILRFELDFETTLARVNVNVLEFIRHTYRLEFSTQVTFSLRCQSNGYSYEEEHTVELLALRMSCFPLLTQLMRRHPEARNQDCVGLWVSGLGEPLDALCARGTGKDMMLECGAHGEEDKVIPDVCYPELYTKNNGFESRHHRTELDQSQTLSALWYSLFVLDCHNKTY